ncbi:uncharacterized protein LOC141620525 [Silene latifolia]|uniref:uncharacterized protein LOC141620525 n=1 Tax=Silene latifolia TaxID=37657 RepID=UPI003D78A445
MEEAAQESYADSPFIDEIARVDLPKKFVIPSIRTYDGTSDPQNHVAFYKQKMSAASIPFASSRELETRSSDLYRVTQIKDESLRSFLARFNKKKVSISRCDIGIAVEAFRQGLLPNNDLYVELTKYPRDSFEDVQEKTIAYIRLEEDKSYKFGGSCNPKDFDKPNRKSGGRSNNYRSGPYTRPDQSEVNLTQEQQGLIKRLDNMGPVVRWPRKKEVAYLLKVGYLKDLIKVRGRIKETSKNNQEQKQEHNLPLPPPLYEVKFINGGLEICGLASSAAKKLAMTPQTKSPCKPDNIPPMTFSGCNLVGIPDIHHDGLVISMQIGTANVRRILVDRASSVNLIMIDMLKAMKIKEDQITK